MSIAVFLYKSLRKMWNGIASVFTTLATIVKFKGNGVRYGTFHTVGIPYVMVSRGAQGITIGDGFAMNNGIKGNPIGCNERCTLFVSPNAEIRIGDNVGISQTALVALDSSITIGNNVKIGGGTQLLTSDFHPLDPAKRRLAEESAYRQSAPIVVEDDVFIGTRCIILKGVTIGARSIIGAGSVVTKSIPADEIWGGNPAHFIKSAKK